MRGLNSSSGNAGNAGDCPRTLNADLLDFGPANACYNNFMASNKSAGFRSLSVLLLAGLLASCATTKKIPLMRWEPGAHGRYEVSYRAGRSAGTASLMLHYGDHWTASLYGPMKVLVFSADLGPQEWTITIQGDVQRFKPCDFMDSAFVARVLNGEFSAIPSHFECQGFEFTWDLPSGRLAGIREDGETLYFIFSREKPVYHISLEAVERGLTMEMVGKSVYRLQTAAP